jgi:hypothetical protein
VTRETALAAGRAFLEQALTDTCLIEREDQSLQTTDPVTGNVTKHYDTVYEGRCEVKQGGGTPAGQQSVAEANIRVGSWDLKLPVDDSPGLRPDDKVTITACPADAELVGRVFWLTNEAHASHKTTRRLPMSERMS